MPDSALVLATPGSEPGSLIDQDMQIEWRGMLFGPGSWCGYKKLSGWEDLPGLDIGSTPIPRAHGSYPGRILMNEKVVTFESQLYPPPDQFADLRRALMERTTVEDTEDLLIVRQHGETLVAYARVTGRVLPIDRAYFTAHPIITIQWTLSDPRRYSIDEQEATVRGAVYSSGLAWDTGIEWDLGLDWGTLISEGSNPVARNNGTTTTYPVIEFIGPLTGPYYVTCPDWRLGFDRSLDSGESIVVDTRLGTAFLGDVNVMFSLAQDSNIPEDCGLPKGDTALTLELSGPTDGGLARITWRDAQE